MSVLLSCSGVSKAYGGVRAVREADLQVHSGEIVGLVGPNGAGKTTLVDVITGQQVADSGDIRLRDVQLTGTPSRRARQAGLARTFQHPQLSLEMTVRENMLLAEVSPHFYSVRGVIASVVSGALRPIDRTAEANVEKVANDLGIIDLERLTGDLSLGDQRLVEVARALLRKPTMLLLDEPFAGGDPRGVASMTLALNRIVDTGCGVLVVDHNVDIVAQLVHRMVLMDQGEVVFDGDPDEAMAGEEMRRVYFGTGGV